jgi:hypothetical protein
MNQYDAYSDDGSGSIPPPPPPEAMTTMSPAPETNALAPVLAAAAATSPAVAPVAAVGVASGAAKHPYAAKLKVFQGAANFAGQQDPDEDDDYFKYQDETAHMVERDAESQDNFDFLQRRSRGDKPTMFCGMAVCFIIIIIASLAYGFGTGVFTNKTTSAQGLAGGTDSGTQGGESSGGNLPTDSDRGGRMYDYLTSVATLGASAFTNALSPESRAFTWLVEEDPLQLDPVDDVSNIRINQRFALLSIWFSSEYDWFVQTGWLEAEDECTWFGVECSTMKMPVADMEAQSVVTHVSLEGNNLQIKVPADIALLDFLRVLNLSKNQLSGPIPDSIQELGFLEELYLDNNNLSGNLEDFNTANLPNLMVLDLSNNGFTGQLESCSFWYMEFLETLVLDNNLLSGTVPADIGNLQALSKL